MAAKTHRVVTRIGEREVTTSMTSSTDTEVEVARVGDRSYVVPAVCKVAIPSNRLPGTADDDDGEAPAFHVSIEVGVNDGDAVIRHVEVHAYRPLTPADVQRIPWAQVMEAALVANAATNTADRRQVLEVRKREKARRARATTRDVGGSSARWAVTDDRLLEVVRLKAEAQDQGLRWDTYAADCLGYSPAYMRRLGVQAKRAGLTP